MSLIRREVANRSNDRMMYYEQTNVITSWDEIEKRVDEIIENARKAENSFTGQLLKHFTSIGLKELAMNRLKTEAKVINKLYPMTQEETESIIAERSAEGDKLKWKN